MEYIVHLTIYALSYPGRVAQPSPYQVIQNNVYGILYAPIQ